jgi:flagellar biosynthesis protein FlhA
VAAIRKQLATELGYVLPAVRLKDSMNLRAHEYALSIKGVEITRYELPPGCELAIPVGKPTVKLNGQATREPAFGIPAVWINTSDSEMARKSGYTVVDPVTILGAHISEFARGHAHELFSREDAKRLLDRAAIEHPKAVEDLVPKLITLPVLQRVLQNLLRERVPIRDAASILEALGEAASTSRNPVALTEFVRQHLRRAVVKPYLNKAGELPAYFLDPQLERTLEGSVEHGDQNSQITASPDVLRDFVSRVERSVPKPDAPVALLSGVSARYFIRQMLENSLPNLFVLSHGEVPPELKVISLGIVK